MRISNGICMLTMLLHCACHIGSSGNCGILPYMGFAEHGHTSPFHIRFHVWEVQVASTQSTHINYTSPSKQPTKVHQSVCSSSWNI